MDTVLDDDEGGASVFVIGVDDRQVDSDNDSMSNATEHTAETGAGNSTSFYGLGVSCEHHDKLAGVVRQ